MYSYKEIEEVICRLADAEDGVGKFAEYLGVRDPRECLLDASIAKAQETLAALKAEIEQQTQAHADMVDDCRHEIVMLSYNCESDESTNMRVSDFAFRLINNYD